MGSRMAGRLVAAGYQVTVFDRLRDHIEQLRRRGAESAESLRALAASVDVIMSSVTDDAALEAIMYGENGVLDGARAGSVIIDMSTVRPRTAAGLFNVGRKSGVAVLDAPVSGSLPQAEQGQLVIFVGGERSVYDRCAPIFKELGKAAFYMGPSGTGTSAKLCANTLLGLGLQALGEAVALGERAGVPRERLLEALADTAVISPSQRSKFDNITRDDYPATFPLRLMYKDFSLILQEALDLSVAMPATAAAAQVAAVEHARETALRLDEDSSVVIRQLVMWAEPAGPDPYRLLDNSERAEAIEREMTDHLP
jgi:3-hydroxyisobutyrate dehydrogenase